jgi:hypothetical protein
MALLLALASWRSVGGLAVRLAWICAWLSVVLAVSACAQNAHHQSTTFLDLHAEPNPAPARFRECHGFSCTEVSQVSLSRGEWQRVGAIFHPPAKNARAERQRIAQAVVLMQRLVGKQTGTAVHQWTHKDMAILPNRGDPTQLDCIDEAVNTWTYMTMMERSGFFRFHRVAQLSNAGTPADPRNTAVLQEKDSSYFAIDPSLVDFGALPPVIPLASWLGSWPPDLSDNDAQPKPGRNRTRLAGT